MNTKNANNEQLLILLKKRVISTKTYTKRLNQHYKRKNTRQFHSSMDKGISQTFRQHLGKRKYLQMKGHEPKPYETYPITRIQKAKLDSR